MGYSSCCCDCVCPKLTEDGQLCAWCLRGVHLGPIATGYNNYADDDTYDPDWNDASESEFQED